MKGKKSGLVFIVFYLFMLFISVYLLTSSRNNVYDTDASRVRYEVTKAIVDRHDVSIPKGLGIRGREGQDYSWYGLGQSIVAIPFYMAGKIMGTPETALSRMNLLFGALSAVVVFLFAISLGYSNRASLTASIFYGLGTMAWPLSKQPFDHTIETFFILLSVYCMNLYVIRSETASLLLSAFSIGLAFITRYTAVLALPSLFVMLTVSCYRKSDFRVTVRLLTKNCSLFFVVFLPFIGLSFLYNYYRFGSVFETGFSLIAARTGIDLFTGTPLVRGLAGFLVSPGKGFFYYSPVALLFFFSLKPFFKRHPVQAISFLCILLCYPLFLSTNLYWHGDWAWGPRYLLPITPFLIIPTAHLMDHTGWAKKYFRVAIYSLFSLSVAIQIAAVSVDFQNYFLALAYEDNVEFTKVMGEGVPTIVEPPADLYFDWHRSHIVTQFKFIYKIAREIKDYKYAEPAKNASIKENLKADPLYNIFDFWWLYKYFLTGGDYSAFLTAFALFFTALFASMRLWKVVINDSVLKNIREYEN